MRWQVAALYSCYWLHQMTLIYVYTSLYLGLGKRRQKTAGIGGTGHATHAQLSKISQPACVVQRATTSDHTVCNMDLLCFKDMLGWSRLSHYCQRAHSLGLWDVKQPSQKLQYWEGYQTTYGVGNKNKGRENELNILLIFPVPWYTYMQISHDFLHHPFSSKNKPNSSYLK